jgi:hypothetical protein
MVINMSTQNYLMINEATNTVDNVCVWDGNTQTWTPPAGYLMLPQATTQALVWIWDQALDDYVLGQQMGQAGIGFTWNGTECVTNEPKPKKPVQPTATGTQDV